MRLVLLALPILLPSACASAPDREPTSPPPAPTTAAPQAETSTTPPPVVQGHAGSSRLREQIPDGIPIIDYRATPENERAIDELLSAAGIYFNLEPMRPAGFAVTPIRLEVTVHREDLNRAMKLLQSAAAEGRLDVVEGLNDLRSRFGADSSRAALNR